MGNNRKKLPNMGFLRILILMLLILLYQTIYKEPELQTEILYRLEI